MNKKTPHRDVLVTRRSVLRAATQAAALATVPTWLAACGGAGGGDGDGDGGDGGGGGGAGTSLTPEQRLVVLDSVRASFDRLRAGGLTAPAQALADEMARLPELGHVSVMPDGCVSARFVDGQYLVVGNNQPTGSPAPVPTGAGPAAAKARARPAIAAPTPALDATAQAAAAQTATRRAGVPASNVAHSFCSIGLYANPDGSDAHARNFGAELRDAGFDVREGSDPTFTPAFIRNYMHFSENSVVLIHACASDSPEMRDAFQAAGASLYGGWSKPVYIYRAYDAMHTMLDMFIGSNYWSDGELPLNRAHDYLAIKTVCDSAGLTTYDDPTEGGTVSFNFTSFKDEPAGLMPTMTRIEVDEAHNRLRLNGAFGSRPGQVLIGSALEQGSHPLHPGFLPWRPAGTVTELDLISWSANEILAKLPRTGPASTAAPGWPGRLRRPADALYGELGSNPGRVPARRPRRRLRDRLHSRPHSTMNLLKRNLAVLALCAYACPMPATAQAAADAPAPVDAATRGEVIDGVIREMSSHYVFPEIAAQVQQVLQRRRREKAFDGIDDARAFARRVSAELRAVTHDKHVNLEYSPEPLPPNGGGEPNPEADAYWRVQMQRRNFGVERVERLAGNVGYLDLRFFASPAWSADTVGAALTAVAHTDALIIDLRRNEGGDPAGVAFACSYLFDSRTHLNDLYWRKGDRTEQFWTQDSVPGRRFGQAKPVFVLTSADTFSAAEEFSYNLKNLKRATLVGETTGGGANPGDLYRLTAHFGIFVPNGRAISPITHTNWEGTGVAPDVAAPAAQALEVAHGLALDRLIAEETDAARKASLQKQRAGLKEGAR